MMPINTRLDLSRFKTSIWHLSMDWNLCLHSFTTERRFPSFMRVRMKEGIPHVMYSLLVV